MKLRQNQSGIAHLVPILVVVIVGLIGLVGWMVYDRRQSNSAAQPTTKEITNFDECVAAGNPVMESYPEQCAANGKTFTNPNQKVEAPKDETADWVTYNDRSGKYSLKYPSNWVVANNLEYCSDNLLLMGVKTGDTTSSVGKCASDGPGAFGQVHLSWIDAKEPDTSCAEVAKYVRETIKEDSTVSVAGTSARKVVTVSINSEEGSWPSGTKDVTYCFEKSGYVYRVSYVQPKPDGTYPDALKDFDLMVTQTLTIK